MALTGTLTRRAFSAVLAAGAPAGMLEAAKREPSFLLLSRPDVVAIQAMALAEHPRAIALRDGAEAVRKKGPWTVTSARPSGRTPAGPHDFYSEAPYWWPDPAHPGGPYIRRDGKTNPDRFTANERDLSAMTQAVLQLGAAAYFYNKPEFAARASEVTRVWFLDDATRMAPHLNFGQAVHGSKAGRPEGLIATRSLIWLLQGVTLAEQCRGWDPEVSAGLKAWFRDFLKWMTTSEMGRAEGDAGNNHASWWTAQAAAFAIYAGDARTRDQMFERYRTVLLKQIEPDGSAPREEARTKSLSYSCFNATALAMTCRLAQICGKDLAHYVRDGVSLTTVVRYLMPFVLAPVSWPRQQIAKFDPSKEYFLGLAALTLGRSDFASAQRRTGLTGGPAADLLALVFDAGR